MFARTPLDGPSAMLEEDGTLANHGKVGVLAKTKASDLRTSLNEKLLLVPEIKQALATSLSTKTNTRL